MRRHVIALMVALLFASAAHAGWDRTPGGGDGQCIFTGGIWDMFNQKNRTCYWDETATGATTQINTRACENASIKFISEIGSGNHGNTVQCFDNQADSVHASDFTAEVIDGKTLDGDPLGLGFAIYGFDATNIYCRFTITTGTARLALHCHP